MKPTFALSAVLISACFWLSPALAAGPVMPCDTGGTLLLIKKEDPTCEGEDCKQLIAASAQDEGSSTTR